MAQAPDRTLRDAILAGEITYEEAVRRYRGPTAGEKVRTFGGVLARAAKDAYLSGTAGELRLIQGGLKLVGASETANAIGDFADYVQPGMKSGEGRDFSQDIGTALTLGETAMRGGAGQTLAQGAQDLTEIPAAAARDSSWWSRLFTQYFPEALGSSAGVLAMPYTGLGIKGVAASGALVGSAQQYTEARAMGAGDREAWLAALGGAALGATEAGIPIPGKGMLKTPLAKAAEALARVDKQTDGSLTRVLWEGAKGAAGEFTQEGLQTIGENLLAAALYDDERAAFESVLDAAAGGGLAGLLMGAVSAAPRRTAPPEAAAGAAKGAKPKEPEPVEERPRIEPESLDEDAKAALQDLGAEPARVTLSEAPAELRDFVAGRGARLVMARQEGGLRQPAAFRGDTIILDESAPEQAWESLVDHEVAHLAFRDAPEAAAKFQEALGPELSRLAQEDYLEDALATARTRMGRDLTPEEQDQIQQSIPLPEEGVARAVEDFSHVVRLLRKDPAAFSKVQDVGLWRRILSALRAVARKLGLPLATPLEKAWRSLAHTPLTKAVAPERGLELAQAAKSFLDSVAGRMPRGVEAPAQTPQEAAGSTQAAPSPEAQPEAVEQAVEQAEAAQEPELGTEARPEAATFTDEDVTAEVERMARTAGWESEGGRAIRDPITRQITGRTKWTPKEPWFGEIPADIRLPEARVRLVVEKALSGRDLGKREQRLYDWMRERAAQNLSSAEQGGGPSMSLLMGLTQEGVPFARRRRAAGPGEVQSLGSEVRYAQDTWLQGWEKASSKVYEGEGRSAVWRRAMGTVGNQGVTWSVPDNLLRWGQDLFRGAGAWTDALNAAGHVIDDNDVRLQETLRKGRTKHRLKLEGERYVQPLREAIGKSGLDLETVGEYLLARSLPDRLALVSSRRGEPQADYGGYTPESAAARVAELDAQSPEYARIAGLFDELTQRKLELMTEFGLISQEQADAMRANEPHYAPWKSDDQAEVLYGEAERPAPRTARTRRKEFKPALGRHTPAENPLVYATMDFVAAIERGMWNSTVGAAALDLARKTNNPKVVTVDQPVMQETLVDGTIRKVPSMALRENELVVKEGGEARVLQFQPGWEPVVRALKGGKHHEANAVLDALRWATRTVAGLSTRWNPAFWPVNWGRDVLGAAFNVTGEQGARVAAEMFAPKRMASSVKEIVTRGPWYQRYEASGAPVAFLDVARGVKEHGERLKREIEELQDPDAPWTMTRQYGRKIADALDWAMNVTEQTARLAAFRYAIEVQGMSDARAAAFAKDLTTNFERRGESQMLGALYAFSNAGIQGTERVARVLSKPGGRLVAGSLLAGAFLLSLMNRWIGGEDDDGVPYWDKVPAWIRASNVILMLPGTDGKRIQIPAPFVWNIPLALGTEIERAPHTGALEATKQITTTVANAINPLGGEADVIDTLTPSLADPFVQLERNRDFAGRRIYPERPGLPDSELAWDSTSPFWKSVAQTLNQISGGDRATPGLADISPESMQHILRNLLGGAGGETGRVQRLAEKILAGEDVGFADVPLWRRYVGEASLPEQREYYRSMKARVEAAVRLEKLDQPYDVRMFRLRGRMRALADRIEDLEDRAREATGEEKAALQERLREAYLRAIKEVRDAE